MKNYKGYYIDGVWFHNENEIDKFLEEQAVKAYKTAYKMFLNHMDMAHSVFCDEKAEILVKNFGYTWSQVEALEFEVMDAAC